VTARARDRLDVGAAGEQMLVKERQGLDRERGHGLYHAELRGRAEPFGLPPCQGVVDVDSLGTKQLPALHWT
jgi:hypothetical protein